MPSSEHSNDQAGPLLDVPRVPVILKDEDGIESPDGLLPRSALNQDLLVIVPDWTTLFDEGNELPGHIACLHLIFSNRCADGAPIQKEFLPRLRIVIQHKLRFGGLTMVDWQ